MALQFPANWSQSNVIANQCALLARKENAVQRSSRNPRKAEPRKRATAPDWNPELERGSHVRVRNMLSNEVTRLPLHQSATIGQWVVAPVRKAVGLPPRNHSTGWWAHGSRPRFSRLSADCHAIWSQWSTNPYSGRNRGWKGRGWLASSTTVAPAHADLSSS